MKHQQIEGCANGTALGHQNLCRSLQTNQVDPIEVPKIDTINSRISSQEPDKQLTSPEVMARSISSD